MTLRSDTAKVVTLADRDLSRLWRLIADGASADEALHDLLPAIVREYGSLGAALAAEWYDSAREKAEVRGRFTALPIGADDRGSHALIGWALSEAKDDDSLKTLIGGGIQRRIADHVRLTITISSIEDPAAEGWVRTGHGECDWCQQYLDGEVRTVEGYDFDAHDWCQCTAEPVFD